MQRKYRAVKAKTQSFNGICDAFSLPSQAYTAPTGIWKKSEVWKQGSGSIFYGKSLLTNLPSILLTVILTEKKYIITQMQE